MHDFDFDKGRKKEKEKNEKEKFSDSKPRHFPRKWPRQKEVFTISVTSKMAFLFLYFLFIVVNIHQLKIT